MSRIITFDKTSQKTLKNAQVISDKNYESEGNNLSEISYELDLSPYSPDQLQYLYYENVITEPELTRELQNRDIWH